MTNLPYSIETPKRRMGSPARALRRAVEFGRQTRIALTSFVRFGEQERVVKSDDTLRSERLVTICQEISRALSPEHHSTGLGLSRCSLCGSPPAHKAFISARSSTGASQI